jgi:hypothetical protein
MGASPSATVVELVERFERDRKVFLSPDYKEEQLRAEFLNPFFTALGWDMDGCRSCQPRLGQMVDGRPPFPPLSSTQRKRE